MVKTTTQQFLPPQSRQLIHILNREEEIEPLPRLAVQLLQVQKLIFEFWL